jgi:hypothetical protein
MTKELRFVDTKNSRRLALGFGGGVIYGAGGMIEH